MKFKLQPHVSATSFPRTVRLFLCHVLLISSKSRARSLGFDASDPKFNHWVKNTAEYYVNGCSLYSNHLDMVTRLLGTSAVAALYDDCTPLECTV